MSLARPIGISVHTFVSSVCLFGWSPTDPESEFTNRFDLLHGWCHVSSNYETIMRKWRTWAKVSKEKAIASQRNTNAQCTQKLLKRTKLYSAVQIWTLFPLQMINAKAPNVNFPMYLAARNVSQDFGTLEFYSIYSVCNAIVEMAVNYVMYSKNVTSYTCRKCDDRFHLIFLIWTCHDLRRSFRGNKCWRGS